MREGQGSLDRTTEMGQPWQDRQDSTVKLGHDIWDMTSAITLDRTAGKGKPGQDSQDRSAWTGKAGQDREDGMPGHDSKDWTVGG